MTPTNPASRDGAAFVDAGLLKILCCPETHQELRPAPPEVIGKLNERIAQKQLKNRVGRILEEKIDGGLVRADGRYLYPIYQRVPLLLVDEALLLT